jgi:hypothetical protein
VVSDVAAPADFEQVHAASAQKILGDQKVLGPRVAAQGDYGVVLEKKQGVAGRAPLPCLDQLLLQSQAALVANPAEAADVERRAAGRLDVLGRNRDRSSRSS